jgi:hypothetical protein
MNIYESLSNQGEDLDGWVDLGWDERHPKDNTAPNPKENATGPDNSDGPVMRVLSQSILAK